MCPWRSPLTWSGAGQSYVNMKHLLVILHLLTFIKHYTRQVTWLKILLNSWKLGSYEQNIIIMMTDMFDIQLFTCEPLIRVRKVLDTVPREMCFFYFYSKKEKASWIFHQKSISVILYVDFKGSGPRVEPRSGWVTAARTNQVRGSWGVFKPVTTFSPQHLSWAAWTVTTPHAAPVTQGNSFFGSSSSYFLFWSDGRYLNHAEVCVCSVGTQPLTCR